MTTLGCLQRYFLKGMSFLLILSFGFVLNCLNPLETGSFKGAGDTPIEEPPDPIDKGDEPDEGEEVTLLDDGFLDPSRLESWLTASSRMTITSEDIGLEDTYTCSILEDETDEIVFSPEPPAVLSDLIIENPAVANALIEQAPDEGTLEDDYYADLESRGADLIAAVLKTLKSAQISYADSFYLGYKFSRLFEYNPEKQVSSIGPDSTEINSAFEIFDYEDATSQLLAGYSEEERRGANFVYDYIKRHRDDVERRYDEWLASQTKYYYFFGDYTYNKSSLSGYTDRLTTLPLPNSVLDYIDGNVLRSSVRTSSFIGTIPEVRRNGRYNTAAGGSLFHYTGEGRTHWHQDGRRVRVTSDVAACDDNQEGYWDDVWGDDAGRKKIRGDGVLDSGYFQDIDKKFVAVIWDCVFPANEEQGYEEEDYKYKYVMRNLDTPEAVEAGWDGLYVRMNFESYPRLISRDDRRRIIVNAYFNGNVGYIQFRREGVYIKLNADGSLDYSQQGGAGLSAQDRDAYQTIHKVFQGSADFLDEPFVNIATLGGE